MACYRRRSNAAVSQDSHRPVGGPRLTVGGGLTGRRSRSFVAAKGFLAAAFTSSGRCSNFPGRCNCSPDRCSCYFAAAAPAKRLFKPTGATIRGGVGATIRPKTTISAAADSQIGSAATTLVLLLIIIL